MFNVPLPTDTSPIFCGVTNMAGFVLGDSRFTIYDPRFTIHDSRLTTRDSRLATRDSRLATRDSRLTTHDSEKMRQVKQKKTMEQEVYFRIVFIVF